jgi:hypothetical protein
VQSLCNCPIEDNTEILYTIYKWDVPSIQYKKRLGRCPLMGEVDRPSLVLIDLNIPELTPGHQSVQAALELPNYVALLAVCRIQTGIVRKESEM